MIAVVDDLGRELRLAASPRRIVSLVPSLTETLFALGAGAAVVAVTRFCVEPADAVASLPKVGGTKNPDLAAIVALAPDLVVMNAEENRREDFETLVARGLACFVTEPKTVVDGIRTIARLGEAVGCAAAAHALTSEQTTRVESVRAVVAGRRPVRYFCPIWRKPWMSFNSDTYAHDMLRLAGGSNVCGAMGERYPTVGLPAVAAALPEVVLLPDEPYHFTPRDLSALPELAETPALRQGRVHFVDGKSLSWYGPRMAGGLEQFVALLGAATNDEA